MPVRCHPPSHLLVFSAPLKKLSCLPTVLFLAKTSPLMMTRPAYDRTVRRVVFLFLLTQAHSWDFSGVFLSLPPSTFGPSFVHVPPPLLNGLDTNSPRSEVVVLPPENPRVGCYRLIGDHATSHPPFNVQASTAVVQSRSEMSRH